MTRPDPRLVEMRRDALRATTAAKIQSRFDALLGVVSFTSLILLYAVLSGQSQVSVYVLIGAAGGFCSYMALRMALLRRRLYRELAKTPVPHDPADPPAQ